MKLSKRRLWIFGAVTLGAIILITFLAAPANNKVNNGSTYGRDPNGYGAWYAFMSERGTPVQRWQKPFEDLADSKDAKRPITLLRVYSGLTGEFLYKNLTAEELSTKERDWVERGNTLVILGVRQPVTEASFSTLHKTEVGSIKIDTQRRKIGAQQQLLSDNFGAIVWQETLGKGRSVFVTTPYLAANAYQDFRSNYEFLAQIVTQSVGAYPVGRPEQGKGKVSPPKEGKSPVWVDEYIHGYKDADARKREQLQNVFSYLGKTPLFPAVVQGLILLLTAIWAGNRRFGKPLTLSAPVVDNSEAYIQALAGVLQKANSSEFVLEIVGKEEQLQLQKILLLGQIPLDHQSLINAWVQQTGRPATELEQLLRTQSRKRRMGEVDLLSWLGKWEQIRHRPPSL